METKLHTVTIGISSSDDAKARTARAFSGEAQGAFISFETVDLLWKVITPKRWEILRLMAGAGRFGDPRGRAADRSRREIGPRRRAGTA